MHENIREHMDVIGADGVHVGTVDHVDGNRIKLVKADAGEGSHLGHHHFIPVGLVASVDDVVRLSANADIAVSFEEESDGDIAAFEDDNGVGESDMGDTGRLGSSEGDSNIEPGQMTGSAPRENNVSVTDLLDESGRGRA